MPSTDRLRSNEFFRLLYETGPISRNELVEQFGGTYSTWSGRIYRNREGLRSFTRHENKVGSPEVLVYPRVKTRCVITKDGRVIGCRFGSCRDCDADFRFIDSCPLRNIQVSKLPFAVDEL